MTVQPEILQDPQERDAFLALLKEEGVRSYLEIGTKFGGMFWSVGEALDPGARMVSVDLPRGTRAWAQSEGSLKKVATSLRDRGHDVRLLWGDSTSPKLIEDIRKLGPFDAILIDANHTLPYVTKDFANYGPMGRLVAFHDIAWRRAPEWVGIRIDVPEFWNEIKRGRRHTEFKFCPTGKNNGIGVLWS